MDLVQVYCTCLLNGRPRSVAYCCFLSTSLCPPTPHLSDYTLEQLNWDPRPWGLCFVILKNVSLVLLVRSQGRPLPRPSSSRKLADPAVASKTLNT